MSQRPTPPTPEELAKRIREVCRDWATLSRAQIEQIASYLEELSTLRRQLAVLDAEIAWTGCATLPPDIVQQAKARHASRTERKP